MAFEIFDFWRGWAESLNAKKHKRICDDNLSDF